MTSPFEISRIAPVLRLGVEGKSDIKGASTMTRKSIEATAKYFIWAIFVLFLFVVFKILQMMGLF